MNWNEIVKIYLTDNYSLNIELGPIVLVIIVIFIVTLILKLFPKRGWGFKHDVELNVSLGGIGGLKIKPNHELEQIAHKAWAELITRKAGLPFDLENDVILKFMILGMFFSAK